MAQENYYVIGLSFHGNVTFSDKTLKKQMVLRAKTRLGRLIFRKKPPRFSESLLQRDIHRIIRFYQTEGFLNTKIQYTLKSDYKHESVKILLSVEEGAFLKVRNTHRQVVTPDSLVKKKVSDILFDKRLSLKLKPGIRYRDATVMADQQKIITALNENGYPYTTIQPSFIVHDSVNAVDVMFNITPGPRCFFGDTRISGNVKTPRSTIQNQMLLRSGDVYSEKKIRESQRLIHQLGMFQFVSIRAMLSEGKNKVLPVEVIVKEAPRFTTRTGVGYGKEDRFRVSLELRKLGFIGGARRLTVLAKHSGLEPYHFSLKFIQPAFINAGASFTVNPFLRQEKELGYTIDRNGANLTYQQRFALFTTGYLNYAMEQDKLQISQMTREQALNNLDIALYNKSSLTLGLSRDSSSPPMSPNSGLYTSMTATVSGLGFRSDFHYARLLLESRFYHQLAENWIIAFRAKIGAMAPTGNSEITPIEERFYSGGSNSVRGWARSELGPKSNDGNPLGGNSLFEGSAELRFPVWKWLSGVCFVDLGNVWRSQFDYNFSLMHFAGGTGLRFKTPIGPVRFDLAWPIFEEQQPVQVHITVGHAF